MVESHSKLALDGGRVNVTAQKASTMLVRILERLECARTIAEQVADHLVNTSLSGVESHGIMRVLQYAEQIEQGYIRAHAIPQLADAKSNSATVNGNGGLGIPAMLMAYRHGTELASKTGMSLIAIKNVGHTGRHGIYADSAADAGFFTLCIGGGNRKAWRQVAPHGGKCALLPTNPWCIGFPGGDKGAVVADFATSKIAGGWIYAAHSADALLPPDCVIDSEGNPTRNPDEYFNGGAILPAGEHKGYGLGLIAELVAEALLGPAATECNWLLITIDTSHYREPNRIQFAAEQILSEMRTCPPASGFERVEVPGERERDCFDRSGGIIAVPEKTWKQVNDLATRLGA